MNVLRFKTLKTIKSLFLLFCLQLIISCNGYKAKKQRNNFKISIDLIAYQQSNIQVFYKLNADDRYYEELSMRKNVSKSDLLQKVIFELPNGLKPKNIRIDIGEHENDCVRIENISFSYKSYEMNGAGGKYKSWFTFNKNVIPDKDSLTFRLKKVDGYFDPQLNGNRILNASIVKLFPPDVYEK